MGMSFSSTIPSLPPNSLQISPLPPPPIHTTNHPPQASISGRALILTDRPTVKKYYSPSLKAWVGDLGDGTHDGGPEDPRIGVIKVEMQTATYALARGTKAGGMLELAKGVVGGSAPKVNKLREISEGEVSTWRTSKQMVQ